MKKLIALVLTMLLLVGVLAACGGPKTEELLENAKDYLDSQMKSKAEATPADYTVYEVLSINEEGEIVKYAVTWTVTKRDGTAIPETDVKVVVAEDGTVTIDVNEKTETDIEYTLTAKITHPDGESVTTSYNRKVPKFVELTHAQFTATADDAAVVIKGIVNGIVNTDTKYELYLQDSDGGYYVYGLEKDQVKDLKIGQEVRVSGIKGTYYGVHQVEDASIEVLNATPVTVEATDITSAIAAASDLTVKDVTKYQSMYVKIKGAFILGHISGRDDYYDVLVGGKTTYLRISSSANMMNEADTTAFKTAFMENVHKDADIQGIVSIYNNKIYLIPVTPAAVGNFTTAERTDAEKVAIEETILDAVGNVTEAGKKTLQSTAKSYTDVTLTWSLGETTYATLSGNVLTVATLPDEEQTIKLTLTLTLNGEVKTKEYNVKIAAAPTVVPDSDITVTPGTAYKFVVRQKNLGQVLYWNGEINSSRYFATTTNPDKAVDVKAELVTEGEGAGKYRLYIDIGGSVKYIVVKDNAETFYPTVELDRSAAAVENLFEYDEELNLFTVKANVIDYGVAKENTYYIGSRQSYDTFGIYTISYITDDNASKIGVSEFLAHFSTLVDTANKTDAEMVAREKTDLEIATELITAGDYTLPTNGELFGKVAISWAVGENALATIEGNVLTVALPEAGADDVVITLTATIKIGEATETKTFDVTIVAPVPLTVTVKTMSEVAAAARANTTDYKSGEFYLCINVSGTNKYFNGTHSSGKLKLTADYTEAVKVYLVYDTTADAYHLCYDKGGVTYYISNASSTSFTIGTDKPTGSEWTIDETNNTLLSKGNRNIRYYESGDDLRAYTSSNGVGYAQFVTVE